MGECHFLVKMSQIITFYFLLLASSCMSSHLNLMTPKQPNYKCFENDLEPVDTSNLFDKKCQDNSGNIHLENATVTSCCECFRYTCQYVGNFIDTNWYFWNKTVSEHCCLHCDGTVYKSNSIIDTTVEDDDCGTIKTSACRLNDDGISPIGIIKLEPSTCS